MPFLALPYFGYRFIYGVYPVLLLLTLTVSRHHFYKPSRHFLLLGAMNLVILLSWSIGSKYMREVPFLN